MVGDAKKRSSGLNARPLPDDLLRALLGARARSERHGGRRLGIQKVQASAGRDKPLHALNVVPTGCVVERRAPQVVDAVDKLDAGQRGGCVGVSHQGGEMKLRVTLNVERWARCAGDGTGAGCLVRG